jgi:predicted SprT family Zn-dependent metalloprotease
MGSAGVSKQSPQGSGLFLEVSKCLLKSSLRNAQNVRKSIDGLPVRGRFNADACVAMLLCFHMKSRRLRSRLLNLDCSTRFSKTGVTGMDIATLKQEARKLLDQFGLTDWTFVLGSYKRCLGRCYTHSKIISVSEWHAAADTPEQVLETVRHEIAHALVPDIKGHGPEWQTAAIKAGCKDIAAKCTDRSLTSPPGKFYAICSSCLIRHTWLKQPKRTARFRCKKCRTELIPVPVKEPLPKPKGLFDQIF